MLELDVVALAADFAGDALAVFLGLDMTGERAVLGDLRRGVTDGCFFLNESNFILELLGSFLGLLSH